MTLTQASKITRIFITFFFLASLVGIISFIGYRIWYANYLASLPPVEEKPDARFGILKLPNFPSSDVSSSNFSYSIDTTTGTLPLFDPLGKVFIMPPTTATLLAGEKSQNLSLKFNLNPNPQILTETKYKYSNPTSNLIVDLDTGNFNFTKEASASAQEPITDNQDQLINNFKIFLNQLGVLNDSLKKGEAKVIFLDPNKKLAQISLWPEKIDQKPIVTPFKDKSLVTATVTKSASEVGNYLSLDFTYWPVDTSSYATYPLKSTQDAFDELQAGKGILIVKPATTKVSITDVSLAYFQPSEYSPYLEPIFVFAGPDFLSYLPAISDSFFENPK